jgi:hypothetical protein
LLLVYLRDRSPIETIPVFEIGRINIVTIRFPLP